MELMRISGRGPGPFMGRGSGGMFWGRGSASLRGARLSYAQGADSSSNRLLALSIRAIQDRLMIDPTLQRFQAHVIQAQARGFRGPTQAAADLTDILGTTDVGAIPTLSPDEQALLLAIAQDPSDEELADLATIDGFFGVEVGQVGQRAHPAFTAAVCAGLKRGLRQTGGFGRGVAQQVEPSQAAVTWLLYQPPAVFRQKPAAPNATSDEIHAITANPFFCETPEAFPDVIYVDGQKGDYAAWFGIDATRAWGDVKLQVENAKTLMDVFAKFPFPPPIDLYWPAWWYTMSSDIQTIVHTDAPIDPEAVRTWITLSVLGNYTAMANAIEADLKSAAKKKKRKAIMTTIGLVVVGLVASFILPAIIAVIAAAIKTAVVTYIDAQKRKEAAQQMSDASKLFADDAPAFSKEVDRAAAIVDQQAAEAQAAQAPSPELKDAIQEVADQTPVSAASLAVGGGVIAAGALALMLFR